MSMEFEQARTSIPGTVDGWLLDQEGELLFGLAKNCQGKGVIVEIGSWKGKSTIWLGKGSQAGKGVKIHAIDPHTGSSEHHERLGKVWTFDEFKQNIASAGVEDVVVPIVKASQDAAQEFHQPIELIFIDGAHEYEAVKQDFDLWFPKVIDGGIMAFHDTTVGEGPRHAVREKLYKSRFFCSISLAGTITYARKVRKNTLKDRVRNRCLLLIWDVVESVRRFPIPGSLRLLGRRIRDVLWQC